MLPCQAPWLLLALKRSLLTSLALHWELGRCWLRRLLRNETWVCSCTDQSPITFGRARSMDSVVRIDSLIATWGYWRIWLLVLLLLIRKLVFINYYIVIKWMILRPTSCSEVREQARLCIIVIFEDISLSTMVSYKRGLLLLWLMPIATHGIFSQRVVIWISGFQAISSQFHKLVLGNDHGYRFRIHARRDHVIVCHLSSCTSVDYGLSGWEIEIGDTIPAIVLLFAWTVLIIFSIASFYIIVLFGVRSCPTHEHRQKCFLVDSNFPTKLLHYPLKFHDFSYFLLLLDENAHGRLGILGLLCVWIYLLGSMERLEKVIKWLRLVNICADSCALRLRT